MFLLEVDKGARGANGWVSWVQFSIKTMEKQLASGGKIRFDLTFVEDIQNVLQGKGQWGNTVTAQELRYLKANWGRFKKNVHFYKWDVEEPAPW